MDDIRDKADSGIDACRMQDAEGTSHVISDPSLHKAATIGEKADEYPRFGDWFETEDGWLECPRSLAQQVIDAVDHDNVAFPIQVDIEQAELVDGEWEVAATVEGL